MSGLILYTSEDGQSRIQLRAHGQTVWLTQLEMAELFAATKQNISLHLKNIFEDGELDPAATVKKSLTVQTETKPRVTAEESSVVQMTVRGQAWRSPNWASPVHQGRSFFLQEQAA